MALRVDTQRVLVPTGDGDPDIRVNWHNAEYVIVENDDTETDIEVGSHFLDVLITSEVEGGYDGELAYQLVWNGAELGAEDAANLDAFMRFQKPGLFTE